MRTENEISLTFQNSQMGAHRSPLLDFVLQLWPYKIYKGHTAAVGQNFLLSDNKELGVKGTCHHIHSQKTHLDLIPHLSVNSILNATFFLWIHKFKIFFYWQLWSTYPNYGSFLPINVFQKPLKPLKFHLAFYPYFLCVQCSKEHELKAEHDLSTKWYL